MSSGLVIGLVEGLGVVGNEFEKANGLGLRDSKAEERLVFPIAVGDVGGDNGDGCFRRKGLASSLLISC